MGFAIRTISSAISIRVNALQLPAIGNGPIKNVSCREKIIAFQLGRLKPFDFKHQ